MIRKILKIVGYKATKKFNKRVLKYKIRLFNDANRIAVIENTFYNFIMLSFFKGYTNQNFIFPSLNNR